MVLGLRGLWAVVGLAFLSACNDDDSYPGCDSTWRCDFQVSSWNFGSSNYWIYGENEYAYYYYDGSLLGQDYVALQADTVRKCKGFDRHDVLSWANCSPSLSFTCDFVKRAKEVYTIRSSATAGKDDRYPPGPGGPLDFDCTR